MASAMISKYPKLRDTENNVDIELSFFIDCVRDGIWQDEVLAVRIIKDKVKRSIAKEKLPYVTISGTFTKRNNDSLKQHSGHLALDFDLDYNPDILDKIDVLYADPYVKYGFVSCSGQGLCLIIKIEPGRHTDAFVALEKYFFENYQVIVDTGCKDVSRPRYVSYDPYCYEADKPSPWKEYIKEKPLKNIPKVVYANNDFEQLLLEIQAKGVNLVDSYHDWMRVGFSMAEKFGKSGEGYFHIVSAQSNKYNATQCSKQFSHCLNNLGKGNRIASISVFYYLAKQAGLNIYSDRTKTIVNASVQGKKSGLDATTVAENLLKYEDIKEAEDIINQVFSSNIESVSEDTLIDQIELYLRHNYELKENEITGHVENNGIQLLEKDINTIYLNIKKMYDKTTHDLVKRIILSDFIPKYNPIKIYFEGLKCNITGLIDAMADTVVSPDKEWTRYFFKKWIVSTVASIYKEHSEIMYILCGPVHGKGKTYWFRHMPPIPLRKYFATIRAGMKETDFNIMMTQKLWALDDECGNKSNRDNAYLKSLLSVDVFTVRKPYGETNVDLRRLAVKCGTTNELEIHTDDENRRYVMVKVLDINRDAYNMIDLEQMWGEAFELFKSGFDYKISESDKSRLKEQELTFQKFTTEYEMCNKYFRKPEKDEIPQWLTSTEIKIALEGKMKSVLKSVDAVAKAMAKLEFERKEGKENGNSKRGFLVVEVKFDMGLGVFP